MLVKKTLEVVLPVTVDITSVVAGVVPAKFPDDHVNNMIDH